MQQMKDKNDRIRTKLRLFKVDKIAHESKLKELKERIEEQTT